MKKIIAVAMALVMVVAFSAVAFADGPMGGLGMGGQMQMGSGPQGGLMNGKQPPEMPNM